MSRKERGKGEKRRGNIRGKGGRGNERGEMGAEKVREKEREGTLGFPTFSNFFFHVFLLFPCSLRPPSSPFFCLL